jgi:hypothetical protein
MSKLTEPCDQETPERGWICKYHTGIEAEITSVREGVGRVDWRINKLEDRIWKLIMTCLVGAVGSVGTLILMLIKGGK